MAVPPLDDRVPSARVLIGLRDALISDAFQLVLGNAGFQVVACAAEPEALLAKATRLVPDIVVVGSDMLTGDDGSAPLLGRLRAEVAATRVVVLLGGTNRPSTRDLLRHGVCGVIPTGVRTSEALAILRQVLDGNVVYPSVMLERLGGPDGLERLSARQREVLELLALGRSNEEIARRLYISRNTVKFHLREIYSRLGVHNRVEATRAAHQVHDQ